MCVLGFLGFVVLSFWDFILGFFDKLVNRRERKKRGGKKAITGVLVLSLS